MTSFLNQTGQEGKAVQLKCRVRGHPNPSVTWYKNRAKVSILSELQSPNECEHSSLGFYKGITSKDAVDHTLIICKTTHLDHTGEYECRANNSKGDASATSFLNVLGKYRHLL